MSHTAYYPHSPRRVQEFRNATAAIKPNETSLMRHEGPCFKCGHLTPSSDARFRRGVERISSPPPPRPRPRFRTKTWFPKSKSSATCCCISVLYPNTAPQ